MGTCTKQTCVLGGPLRPQQCEDWQVAQEELALVIAHTSPHKSLSACASYSLFYVASRVLPSILWGGWEGTVSPISQMRIVRV